MNRFGPTLAAGLGVLFMVSAASAETHILAESGSWGAFGGTTDSGRGVCGISGSPGGRYFGLKLFAGDDTFTVQMQVPQIQDKGKVGITVKFDANSPWHATGTGFHFNDGDAGLEFTINRSEAQEFVSEFRNSSTMVIETPTGVFPRWTAGLQGTLAVSTAFSGCLQGLRGGGGKHG